MNVEQAKQLFRDSREDFVSEYADLAKLLRESRIVHPARNGNYLHALVLTDLMMRSTASEFLMVTGGSGDGFLHTLQDTFRDMLRRLRENDGKARIIVVDGKETNDHLESCRSDFADVLEYTRGSSPNRISHYIVADEEMIRDEQPHPPISSSSPANQIKANVYFHNPGIASHFRQLFQKQWTTLAAS